MLWMNSFGSIKLAMSLAAGISYVRQLVKFRYCRAVISRKTGADECSEVYARVATM